MKWMTFEYDGLLRLANMDSVSSFQVCPPFKDGGQYEVHVCTRTEYLRVYMGTKEKCTELIESLAFTLDALDAQRLAKDKTEKKA